MTQAFRNELVLIEDDEDDGDVTLAHLLDLPVHSDVATVSDIDKPGNRFQVTVREANDADRKKAQGIITPRDAHRIQWVGRPYRPLSHLL